MGKVKYFSASSFFEILYALFLFLIQNTFKLDLSPWPWGMSLVFFYTLWKHQQTRGFLMFSEGYRKRPAGWNRLVLGNTKLHGRSSIFKLVIGPKKMAKQNTQFIFYCKCKWLKMSKRIYHTKNKLKQR